MSSPAGLLHFSQFGGHCQVLPHTSGGVFFSVFVFYVGGRNVWGA